MSFACQLLIINFFLILVGTAYGGIDNPKLTYAGSAKLWAGSNKISILSISVGLPVSIFCSNVVLCVHMHHI